MKKFISVLLVTIIVIISNSAFSQVTTIPAGASPYANLGAAFTAINAGGPYTGVAVTVTITANLVEPAVASLNGGVFTTCLIRPSGVRTVTGNLNTAVIRMNGADNVTIDGLNSGGNSLTIVNPNAGTGANGIELINGSTFDIIRNVAAVGLGASAGSAGGRGLTLLSSIAGSGGNNDNIIENCSINGFRRGIQDFGTDGNGVFGYYNERNIIRNNSIKNATSLSIFIGTATADDIVEGNTIFQDAAVANDPAGLRTINIQGQGTNIVRNNKIRDITGTVAGGFIGLISIPAKVLAPLTNRTTRVDIYNNFVALNNCLSSATFIYGIYPTSNTNTVNYTSNVYFNSINIAGSSGATVGVGSVCLVAGQDGSAGVDTAKIYNNICMNNRTDGDATSIHYAADYTTATSVVLEANSNLYGYTDTTGNGFNVGFDGFVYRFASGLVIYESVTCPYGIEQLSDFGNVNFVSSTDLHLAGPIGINMAAKNIPAITTDIDGTSRAITGTNPFTYKGADEVLPSGAATRKSVITITVALQDAAFSPVNILGGIANSTGSLNLKTPTNFNGSAPVYTGNLYCGSQITSTTQYYLDISSINSIYTFSGTPQTFPSVLNTYDFTSALTQAFGSNMAGSSAPFAIYQGDVNQDEIIDAGDLASVENDVGAGVSGCKINTDVNYDEITDASDLAIVENNVGIGIFAALPFAPASVSNGNNANVTNSAPKKVTGYLNNIKERVNN